MASRSKRKESESARKDVVKLFVLAKEKSLTEPGLADRYVAVARRLAEKHRISLRQYNRVHCRKCKTYWTSKTLRVRTRPTAVVYSCLVCGNVKRVPKR